ncbi:MAG: hypothetical protein NC201_04735 [Prevotella sp.]|nr:hypothetical protein [Bacteroides sp.]MCM1366536.1 hypothetical protein [Prevotella sp.]
MDKKLNLMSSDAHVSAENKGESTPRVPLPPLPPKKKKRRGCLIAVGVFVFLIILTAIFSDDDDKAKSNSDNISSNSTEVVTEDMGQGNVVTIDSVKIKELKPFFKEEKDEFKGITWVMPKARPQYTSANGICTYFSLNSEGKPENLRFLIQYYADDWLFIDSYTFLIDGKTYAFSNPDVERDNDSMIWEWSDTGVAQNREVAKILYAIKNAKEVKIRFNGRQYHKDKVLSEKDIKAIQQPIEYFEALGGRF